MYWWVGEKVQLDWSGCDHYLAGTGVPQEIR
jgi:hypothetical protein